MNIDLNDKVVIITGAAGGLGTPTVGVFADAGASLAVVGHKMDKLEAAFGDAHLRVQADLTDESAVEQMVERVIAEFGRIDALVNIAGGFTMGAKTHETETKTWEFMHTLNATATYLTCKHVLKQMVEQSSGAIVNVGAYAATVASKQKMTPYLVSKQAVIRLTEALSAEYRQQNIRVNCILPGTIDTEQNRQSMPDANHDNWVAPADIGRVIAFLCSDMAREVSGAKIPVIGKS